MTPTPSLKAIASLSRAPFLILAPLVVLLGVSSVAVSGEALPWLRVALVMLGALAAHVAVNSLNEYADFRSGLDALTERTPFSGGSGWLPEHPEQAPLALGLGALSLMAMVLIGLYLSLTGAPWLVVFGLAGTGVIVTYTPWLNRLPWLCLLAPGTGFGLLMVNGTHYALTGSVGLDALLVSLSVFFLVNNLLLLNQFPDLEADKASGRHHAVIAWGKARAARVFNVFLVLAYLPLLLGWGLGVLPPATALALLLAPLAIVVGQGVLARHSDRQGLMTFMGLNVALVNLMPLVLAIGLFS